MHPRSIIRQLFVDLLTGATDCGQSVFKQRSRPFVQVEGWQSELPAIIVYTNTDASQVWNQAPLTFERTASVNVEIHAAADEETDDLLDHIAEQVEIIIGRYNWEAGDMRFSIGDTRMQLVESGSQINGALAMTFPITYYSDLPDSGKTDTLEDFKTASNTFRIGQAENKQTVEIP